MKRLKYKVPFLAFLAGFVYHPVSAQTWARKPVTIETRWAKDVSPINALKEYPRPQLERKHWTNLNGLWQYAITAKDQLPADYQGQILVPYPIESSLSGVKKQLLPEQSLWYKRSFKAGKGRTLLHFGAVDFQATVYINGKEAGSHEGGYTAFSIDITDLLKNGDNELTVKVWDPSDQGYGPHGKQVLKPEGIFYTPSSGIWQTVWLEEVPDSYIDYLDITPDIDHSMVSITAHSRDNQAVVLNIDGKTVKGNANQAITVPIGNPKLWSPADPYLYSFTAKLGKDEVKSYFGMRKISVAKDKHGNDRIFLNNKAYYNLGTLDQGFWPDGLYTAPTDEALSFDIKAIKAMGFNTIRKHIKVEPARWYYWADKLGMLVWQDMVNPNQGLPAGAKAAFERQCAEEISQLHNYPSITTWVLFNEKWGQYDQERLTRWLKQTDPGRIVNGHTGEYLYVNNELRSPSPYAYIGADITDVHAYPDPANSIRMEGKARVCGEFGGIGVFVPDHQWNASQGWGYVQEKPADLQNKFAGMVSKLEGFRTEGLSGSIYTQPFDVEGEQNGLMTYDREVVKIPFAELRRIHSKLNPDANTNVPDVSAQNMDLTDPEVLSQKAVAAFRSGDRDPKILRVIIRSAGKLHEEGFRLMVSSDEPIRKVMGSPQYSDFMSGILLNEAIQPLFAQHKTWEEIGQLLMQGYGKMGEETYLKIRSIGALNNQDWKEFLPVAKQYLAKYGSHLSDGEKANYEGLIKKHETNE